MIGVDDCIVTLSMPVYQSEKYIKRALLSVLNQDFDQMEILIIDNGCTDGSMQIVQDLINEYAGLKEIRILKREKNIGLGDARNLAIDYARGKYLIFMDSDDEIMYDCVSKLYSAMKESFVDFVAGSYNKSQNSFVFQSAFQYDDIILRGKGSVAKYFFSNRSISVTMWNKLYDVSFLRTNKIYCIPQHINEDLLFSLKLFVISNSCRLISDVTLNYYIYSNSFNGNIKKNWTLEYMETLCDIMDLCRSILLKYKKSIFEYDFIRWVLRYLFYISYNIIKSVAVSHQKKKELISYITYLPLNYIDLIRFSISKYDFVSCFIFTVIKSPYCVKKNLLICIYKFRFIKKII